LSGNQERVADVRDRGIHRLMLVMLRRGGAGQFRRQRKPHVFFHHFHFFQLPKPFIPQGGDDLFDQVLGAEAPAVTPTL
jgi:hypothetical protein